MIMLSRSKMTVIACIDAGRDKPCPYCSQKLNLGSNVFRFPIANFFSAFVSPLNPFLLPKRIEQLRIDAGRFAFYYPQHLRCDFHRRKSQKYHPKGELPYACCLCSRCPGHTTRVEFRHRPS
jgi:hypothetical protein